MNKRILVALCSSAMTDNFANALNAECVETDHSACESSECCGVLEEEGFNFLEALEEYWGAHHEHVHLCNDETATTYEDAEGETWAFHCEELETGANYQLFTAAAVAISALMTLF